jgi:hypothetical protein
MKGNVWENSTGVRKEVCSDEDVEDVGDGGPSAEGNTKECDASAELDIFDETDALWLMGAITEKGPVRSFCLFTCHPRT